MINRLIIRKNVAGFSIALFIVLFVAVQTLKPGFIYNSDGSFREFGIGYKSKTVVPIWLVTIILAFLSYVTILYYVE
jgi:hypothetical protein